MFTGQNYFLKQVGKLFNFFFLFWHILLSQAVWFKEGRWSFMPLLIWCFFLDLEFLWPTLLKRQILLAYLPGIRVCITDQCSMLPCAGKKKWVLITKWALFMVTFSLKQNKIWSCSLWVEFAFLRWKRWISIQAKMLILHWHCFLSVRKSQALHAY